MSLLKFAQSEKTQQVTVVPNQRRENSELSDVSFTVLVYTIYYNKYLCQTGISCDI
uniref:Uncharacterized protein n=1 Tax=Heterorhabditis bacteriophora TaxID=37862 RepID=A0A1I7WR26_HETBA